MKIIEVLEGTRCWKGYEKKGMKTMFGKRVPNCVKREHVDFCVNCHGLVLHESLDETLKKWFKDIINYINNRWNYYAYFNSAMVFLYKAAQSTCCIILHPFVFQLI